jgi:hypothetical protein
MAYKGSIQYVPFLSGYNNLGNLLFAHFSLKGKS